MSFDWSQNIVFITGASSGIGRSLAIELGRMGATVGLLARRAESLREIVSEVEAAGGRALALPADVKDARAVRAAADQLRERFGRVDVLVANAGIAGTTDAIDLQPDEVANVINVNVLGAVNSVTAV
ncbi:MAG TPA: SDR family NAD(P)-dependent oxidoreductase, partial [Pyrinomonadaceae bacterium]|nr:SDR family NAD(P)-dependent oxidoreductase [Pyrinomonadaceae bacterium]